MQPALGTGIAAKVALALTWPSSPVIAVVLEAPLVCSVANRRIAGALLGAADAAGPSRFRVLSYAQQRWHLL